MISIIFKSKRKIDGYMYETKFLKEILLLMNCPSYDMSYNIICWTFFYNKFILDSFLALKVDCTKVHIENQTGKSTDHV